MKLTVYIFSILMMIGMASCKDKAVNKLDVDFLGSKIHFTTLEETKTLISTSDAFTQSQSPFDFASKTGDKSSVKESDYLQFAKGKAVAWTVEEIDETSAIIQEAERKIKKMGLKINLPEVVSLLKTTCAEEGGAAGYTREDYIVVSGSPNEHLFLHELFHIISRQNPILKNDIYKTIGFQECARIQFPEYLKDRKITNPDAPFFDNYITVKINGQDQDAIIVTLAKDDYDGGSFFKYLQTKLMIVEGDSENKIAKLENDKAVLYDFNDATNLLDQIGRNTGYNIHPEEICAEHFTMMVVGKEVKEQEYITKLKAIFQ